MLDIPKRIEVIQALITQDTPQSLIYAALECRLTIEYLCYERFKLFYAYLPVDDLKKWQPKDVVRQISTDIDENVDKAFTLSISSCSVEGLVLNTKEDYEQLEYISLGQQSELNLRSLHSLWNALANVALHIPVPTLASGQLNIYGEKLNVKKKVEAVINYLSTINGNLLLGGPLGRVFSFKCGACNFTIKKPFKNIRLPMYANCINPQCTECYLLEPEDCEEKIKVTRCIYSFNCKACNSNIDVPKNVFSNLRFNQQLDIKCGSCQTLLTLIMRPFIKEN